MSITVSYGDHDPRPEEEGIPFCRLSVGDFFFMASDREGELWMKYGPAEWGTPADGYRDGPVDPNGAIVYPAAVTLVVSRARPVGAV